MKLTIRGKGNVTLSQNDFIFEGGEAKVYGKGDTAYKIYDDLQKLIPPEKIDELNAIAHSNVIKPEDIILNLKGTYVGFTMRWIKNSVPLVKLFTNDFRNRNQITDTIILELIEAIKEAVNAVHQAKCLVVDANELNFLADDQTFTIPYLIDVNSYQTPSFPATAIMLSIRDVHSFKFSELTDWFSFGIIACQLFVGIHPYKGKHPDYTPKTCGNDVLLKRMKDNISIFNPKVSMPPTARDKGCIPTNYLSWFIDLFEKGRRLPPPMAAVAVVTQAVGIRIIHSTRNFEIKHLMDFESDIVYHDVIFGIQVTKTKERLYIGKSSYPIQPDTEVIFTPKYLKPMLISIENHYLKLTEIKETQGKIQPLLIECTEKMIVKNTLYVRNLGNLIELAFIERADGNITPAIKSTWNIMPHASEVYSGVIYQSVLGTPYLVIPLPKSDGQSSCIVIPVPELKHHRVIAAKHENRICMVIAHYENKYRKLVLIFDSSYTSYDCKMTDDIEYLDINFVVLSNGISVAISEDNAMEVFVNQKGNQRMDILKDSDIPYPIKLCHEPTLLKFFKNNALYSIRRVT
ncbi:MAG: hypothetical protein HQK77_04645 [Desulfobacterales bacterium]|nr:hypothetical protein [Desulfobacterales bacterium]